MTENAEIKNNTKNRVEKNNKRVVFRFDIDTPKCLQVGVPNLLKIARKHNVKFTFFLNCGKATSRIEAAKKLISKAYRKPTPEQNIAPHLSAFQKLGIFHFCKVALLNPKLHSYRKEIEELANSQCELGLHGGSNHGMWLNHAASWPKEIVIKEMKFGLRSLEKIVPNKKILSFASPGWATSQQVEEAARELGFTYLCDRHTNQPDERILTKGNLTTIPTNILAEEGGVAFFENCTARGLSQQQTLEEFFQKVSQRPNLAIVYDHPHFSGTQSLQLLDTLITRLKNENYKICAIEDLK
jgi:undecaprenyl phosphate-alpha-L-ara4FN deformylase